MPACILAGDGTIVAVNDRWRRFGLENGLAPGSAAEGSNYVAVVERARAWLGEACDAFLAGLRAVRQGTREHFDFRYDCSAPGVPRWFKATVTRLPDEHSDHVLIVHRDITEKTQALARLRANEAFADVAARAAQVGGWFFDRSSNRVDWSPAVAAILQVDPAARHTLEDLLAFIEPAHRSLLVQCGRRCYEEAVPFDIELRGRTALGREVWLRFVGLPEQDDAGRVTRIQGACQDITGLKAAEAAAKQTAARLQATLDSLPAGFYVLDADWRFTYVNPEGSRILRAPPDELVGQDIWDAFPGSWDSDFGTHYRMAMTTRRPVDFEAFYEPFDIWVHVSVFPLPDGLAVTFNDVTERYRIRQALRESERYLETAVTASGLGIWRWDVTAGTLVGSHRISEMLGLPLDEPLTPERFVGILHPDDRADVEQVVARARPGDDHLQADFRVLRSDGEIRWFSALGRADSDGQGGVRIDGVTLDITDRKAAEDRLLRLNEHLETRVSERTRELEEARAQAEDASAAKSAFLAVLSHELRTPLNGILGMADVLHHSRLSPHQQDSLDIIRRSAVSLLRMIEDILDFSKIEAGRIDLEALPVAVVDIVEEVCSSLQQLATSAGVDLFAFVDPDVPAEVLGDPTRLKQMLFNLVGNAVKFSGGLQHAGRVEVRCTYAAGIARFVVRDNGIGMSRRVREGLFRPFWQGDASMQRRYGGTGLGLAVTGRLVDVMGGNIAVDSRVWEGSVFTVELPLPACSPPVDDRRLAGLHCVLVESSEFTAADLARYLASAGARVDVLAADALAQDANARDAALLVHGTSSSLAVDDAAITAARLEIGRGRRRTVRRLRDGAVGLDGPFLRREAFIDAAAIACGRAAPVVQPRPPRPAQDVPALSADAPRPSILIAEDDPTSQEVLVRQLALLGHAAEVAPDGLRAFRAWWQGRHAIVLSDLHMPAMDGYGLLGMIRGEEEPERRTRVVAITADAFKAQEMRAYEAGFDAFLTKPTRLEALRDLLAGLLPASSENGSEAMPDTRFDPRRLAALVGGDEAAAAQLLPGFEQALQQYLATLEGYPHRGTSLDEVASIAHRLKSAARSVGADTLADLAVDLERAARGSEHAAVMETIIDVTHEAQATLQALAAHLHRPCGHG